VLNRPGAAASSSHDISFVITCLAGAVALLVALTLPVGYFAIERKALVAELETEAEVRSATLARSVIANHGKWPEQHIIEGALSQNPQLKSGIQANSLFDSNGELLVMIGDSDPARPLEVYTAGVFEQGRPIGTLRLTRSIRSLYEATALAAFLGALLGGAVFIAFRVLPLRALRKAIDALHEEIASHAEARREAESANRAKSLFLAAASHDLRQPLHALSMFAGVLEAQEGQSESRDLVHSINNCVEALEHLFSTIMDISKLDAGVLQPERSVVPMATVLERLRADFEQTALAKGIRLKVRGCGYNVYTDPVLLQRILSNLIANAVRYTETGRVLVGCRRRGSSLRVEVRDTGPGIAQAELSRIFEEFYQVGNQERDRSQGLGLGLAIVRRLGTLLEHDVAVKSKPGKGSCFSVELPLDTRELNTPSPAKTASVERYGGKVLVVIDDEPAVRDGMALLLRHWGCDPVISASLQDARAELARRGVHPDAVIADYRLRDAVGTDAIVALRAQYGKTLPAAVITGDIGVDRLAEFAASGFRHLHKPVPASKLRELVDSLLAPA
jgi:two-component system, sensor histidine kinase